MIDALTGKPLSGVRYVLKALGARREGTTDGSGKAVLQETLPSNG